MLQYASSPYQLSALRQQAENDPCDRTRESILRELIHVAKDDPALLPWLKERARKDSSSGVVRVAVEAIARYWKEDPGTLNWLKIYAQASQRAIVRRVAMRELARGWKNEFNVFEILCKCITSDPFVRRNELETNPRQTALEIVGGTLPRRTGKNPPAPASVHDGRPRQTSAQFRPTNTLRIAALNRF
ncbi:MAG: hypothetical protein HC925_05960 [Coleofasciculaceae cyanobacterium SM2_3_26]|nr:hypothetical protein [Coleofasciculaceae cyanobacterium SM2_3_26]